jgi:hypothetical protein
MAVLKRAAAAGALKVVPLLGVSGAHAAEVALHIPQRPIAFRADNRGRSKRWMDSLSTLMCVAQHDAVIALRPLNLCVAPRLLLLRFVDRRF